MLGGMTSRVSMSRGPARWATRLTAVLTASALSFSLSACGGDDKGAEKPAKKPDSQPIEGGTELAALWPLTGLPVKGEAPDRPVIVAKIDNTDKSKPQVGLGKADLITEQLVEGGITRLAVFYYSQLPNKTGPVRSMRATDIGIVKPAHGVVVASGGAPPTQRRFRAANLPYYTESSPGFYRETGRSALYSVMVNLPKLAKAVKNKAKVPASYLPWGAESDFSGGQPATRIAATFSQRRTTQWRYQGGKYRMQNGYAAAGDQYAPDTVLAIRVRVKDAGYRDLAGSRVPESIYQGRGEMMLFHKGQVVRGTWSKKTNQSALQLSTAAGPIKVPAGHVFVELVPTNKFGGRVAFQK